MNKILLIDDDEKLCSLVSKYLTVEGFQVEAVHDGVTGLEKARTETHNLVILDVMLPKKNGYDVLRGLRESSQIPVIMLTAKGDDMEKIIGLEIGSDDYLPKPFNPRELVARIRAILRRASDPTVRDEKYKVGDIEMVVPARSATRNGFDLGLTGIEFELLLTFLKNAGTIVKKEVLSEQVLEREASPFDRSLDMHISNLRKKLDNDRIKTIRASGYIYTVL